MQNGRGNLAEYAALRDEIVNTEQSRITCKMYMYVTFFAVFSLAVEFHYRSLFLVALVILLIFQSFINFYYWMIRKVSIYIKIFYEGDENQIYWESMQDDKQYTKLDKKFHKYASVWVADHAASFFAIITSFFDLYYIFEEKIERKKILCSELPNSSLPSFDVPLFFEITCSVLLCIAVLVVTHEVNSGSKDEEITEAIQNYKDSIDWEKYSYSIEQM